MGSLEAAELYVPLVQALLLGKNSNVKKHRHTHTPPKLTDGYTDILSSQEIFALVSGVASRGKSV